MTFRIFLRSAVTAIGLGGITQLVPCDPPRWSSLTAAQATPRESEVCKIRKDVSSLEAVALWLAPFLAPYLVFDGVAKASEMAISRPSIL